jgi:hypothetical protein
MKRTLAYLLVVGVPGLCFVIGGALSAEYQVAAFGGVLVIGTVYALSRKRVPMVYDNHQKQRRRSFAMAGIFGASIAAVEFTGHRYLMATVGIALLIGALLRLYGSRTLAKR